MGVFVGVGAMEVAVIAVVGVLVTVEALEFNTITNCGEVEPDSREARLIFVVDNGVTTKSYSPSVLTQDVTSTDTQVELAIGPEVLIAIPGAGALLYVSPGSVQVWSVS
jgi:hypothetical protein